MKDKILVTHSSMPPYEEYIERIKPLWDSHWITNMGTYHKELEEKMREYLGVPYVSLMVNGHMSLELAIQAMDFPEGSEVITTPFTFISTTHAIVRNRLEPVFCDIKVEDFTIDENKIEALITEKTVAIVPVHVYGNICNVEAIEQIARRHHLKVIYDAAHAFGEHYKGAGVGNYGDVATFSFHATKVFNTIEGGAVVSHSKDFYDRLYNLKNFGIRGEELVVSVGANAKMNEFAAVMGLCNLPYVEENIRLRKEKINLYRSCLKDLEGLKIPSYDQEGVTYNYAYFQVLFPSQAMRDRVYDALEEQNIYARKYFYPLTADADCFAGRYRDSSLECARRVAEGILVLPLYPELEDSDIRRICEVIAKQKE